MDMVIPPLRIKILLESNPLKSRLFVRSAARYADGREVKVDPLKKGAVRLELKGTSLGPTCADLAAPPEIGTGQTGT